MLETWILTFYMYYFLQIDQLISLLTVVSGLSVMSFFIRLFMLT